MRLITFRSRAVCRETARCLRHHLSFACKFASSLQLERITWLIDKAFYRYNSSNVHVDEEKPVNRERMRSSGLLLLLVDWLRLSAIRCNCAWLLYWLLCSRTQSALSIAKHAANLTELALRQPYWLPRNDTILYGRDKVAEPFRPNNAMQIRRIYISVRWADLFASVCMQMAGIGGGGGGTRPCWSSGTIDELPIDDLLCWLKGVLRETRPGPCDWRRADVLHRVTDQLLQLHCVSERSARHHLFLLSTDVASSPASLISHQFTLLDCSAVLADILIYRHSTSFFRENFTTNRIRPLS